MVFFRINPKKKIKTILVMRLLKMVEVDVVVLVVLVVLVGQIFQIYLRTFLGTLVVAEKVPEVTVTEVLI